MAVWRVAQFVQQAAGVLELVGVLHPQLGQGLVGRHLAGDAAGVLALHRGGHAGVAQQVGPQRGEREIRCSGQALHQVGGGGCL